MQEKKILKTSNKSTREQKCKFITGFGTSVPDLETLPELFTVLLFSIDLHIESQQKIIPSHVAL